jgi:ParB-like nuclease domain
MKLKVHPKAALFPMLTKEELNELAADIKANGLRQPIALDKDDQVVDGRNRLAACEIAKVKPEFTKLNGVDAEAFILSQNLARRHMTPAQRAMVVAMMHPDGAKAGRGEKAEGARKLARSGQFPMVTATSLKSARRVLRLCPDLAPLVLSGAKSLESAYVEAKNREELAASDEAKMERLRDGARDLADLVTEKGMEIDEALAAMHERERKKRETIEQGKQAAETGLVRFLGDVASIIAAVKESDAKFLDKKRLAAVDKATKQLLSLL